MFLGFARQYGDRQEVDHKWQKLLEYEAEIMKAQSLLMSCLKIVVEPSAAVSFAALLKDGPHHAQSKVICVVISGGNSKV